jgi:hypothetical protein
METRAVLNASARRRRRIAGWAVLPILVAVAVGWLESGSWIVVYNDTPETLAEIHIQRGADQWIIRDLGAQESRRVRLRRREPAETVVTVADWTSEPIHRQFGDGRETVRTTLRLDAARGVGVTSESGFWNRSWGW